MSFVSTWKALGRMPAVRTGLLVLGWLLVVASPAVGVLPGPGGIFVFAAGLGLVLKNSLWAKRRYAAFKRRWPKHGELCDRGLRRPSARRRRRREAAQPD
ncbi:MAG TPA: PGPGW domain-containing protein [Sphingomonadaceae bacterium]|nr:PGPGW domain-containing protein [Sphingomonadaceae bacterium]